MTVRAAGLIIYRFQPVVEFLLLQASYGEKHWSPPKGHVDPGEDELTTAKRETVEEAGLNETHYKIDPDFKKVLSYSVNDKPKSVTYWVAELLDVNTPIKLSDEHLAYIWCNLEDALKYAKYEEMKNVISEAHSHIMSKQKKH